MMLRGYRNSSTQRVVSTTGATGGSAISLGSSCKAQASDCRASAGRPRHVVTSGQTPVLDPAEARALPDSIDVSTHVGLRDCAPIGPMVYSFAPIGAALGMMGEDVFTQNRRLWERLREGRQAHAMPCHHNPRLLRRTGPQGDPKGSLVRNGRLN
jgi:hypothetical protein